MRSPGTHGVGDRARHQANGNAEILWRLPHGSRVAQLGKPGEAQRVVTAWRPGRGVVPSPATRWD